jgi:hypothetical protein
MENDNIHRVVWKTQLRSGLFSSTGGGNTLAAASRGACADRDGIWRVGVGCNGGRQHISSRQVRGVLPLISNGLRDKRRVFMHKSAQMCEGEISASR